MDTNNGDELPHKRKKEDEGASNEAQQPIDSKKNIQWANIIKQRHATVREQCKAATASTVAGATSSTPLDLINAAWDATVQDEEALAAYSEAMHHLATEHWDKPSSAADRYEDRILYTIDCIKNYFIGEPVEEAAKKEQPQDGTPTNAINAACTTTESPNPDQIASDVCNSSKWKSLPSLLTRPMKDGKRAFYQEHNRMMNDDDIKAWTSKYIEDHADEGSFSLAKCLLGFVGTTFIDSGRVGGQSAPVLKMLDVGSCYNPYKGKALWESEGSTIPLDVVGVDLGPYPGSGVLKCDWIRVKFNNDAPTPHSVVASATASAIPSIVPLPTLPPRCVDAISFTLLLSYMPTSQMRFQACINAYRALRPHGLLVIVSTRTQGSRSVPWIDPWVSAVESIGFVRVDKHIRHKLVGLSFRKKVPDDDSHDEEAWAVELVKSSPYATKMTITADAL